MLDIPLNILSITLASAPKTCPIKSTKIPAKVGAVVTTI